MAMTKQERQLNSILKYLESKKAEEDAQQMFKRAIETKSIITQMDLLNAFKITLVVYQKLNLALNKHDLNAFERDTINRILAHLTSYNEAIEISNYKIIASGAPIKKTAMYYITKKGTEARRDFVIINVGIKGVDEITLERLLLNEEEKK